jgi:hypothetical protein
MKDMLLCALNVIEMLEKPVVTAYGRENFNRLIFYPSHMLIHAHELDEDIAILEWCASLLQRNDIYVFFETEKTKRGQIICRLVAGRVGALYERLSHYLNYWLWAKHFVSHYKNELPPETEKALSEFIETMRFIVEEDLLLWGLEDTYNMRPKVDWVRLKNCCKDAENLLKYAEEDWQKVVQLLPEHIKSTLNAKER